jgi:hypothetical protein
MALRRMSPDLPHDLQAQVREMLRTTKN